MGRTGRTGKALLFFCFALCICSFLGLSADQLSLFLCLHEDVASHFEKGVPAPRSGGGLCLQTWPLGPNLQVGRGISGRRGNVGEVAGMKHCLLQRC